MLNKHKNSVIQCIFLFVVFSVVMVSAILTFIALSKRYSVIYYIPTPMLKEYLCDNHSQWNNSFVAKETQSPLNDKEKRTMYPRQPPRVLQKTDLMNSKTGILCVMLTAGLGNNIFQFASTFGIAMSKNMTFIVNRNSYINYVFKLNVNFTNDYSVCKTFKVAIEKLSGTYDEKLLSYNSSQNLRIGHYLQSWKYFYQFRKEIREQLIFQDPIQDYVNKHIDLILYERGISSRKNITLVGVHVRRGDKLQYKDVNVASQEYLHNAVHYFRKKYGKVLFIVASNGMEWTKKNMPKDIIVKYIQGTTEADLAMLASCDHVITTIGTFSWWSGWLAGGEVTYVKSPAKPGTPLAHWLNYKDYFDPEWIGL